MKAKITRTAVMRERQCTECKGTFLSRSSKKIYCDGCGLKRERAMELARRKLKARSEGVRAIGSEVPCRDCGERFVLVSGPEKTCPKCRPLRVTTWMRNRYRTNIRHNISDRMRRRINEALGRGRKAGRRWPRLLGFTVEDLMAHLEAQFLPGMTWENRGEWEIDHIRPLCSFKFQTPECPQFREAWRLSNLRPLWMTDNRRKGGRWKRSLVSGAI